MTKFPSISIIIPVYKRRDLITTCLESIKDIDYPNFEVIVVDDLSGDGTVSYLRGKYPQIKVISNKENSGASISRDNGAGIASGELLFFLDSDTVVDRNILKEFVGAWGRHPRAGLLAPMIYYYGDKNRIWYAGAFISMTTSQANYRGLNQIDSGQFKEGPIKGGHAPTAAIIPREIFIKSGGYARPDCQYMGFEEPDLAQRIEKLGKQIVFCPRAKVWHQIDLPQSTSGIWIFFKDVSFRNEKIAYSTSRNRVIFMKKYARRANYVCFRLIFLPLSLLIYKMKCTFSGKKTIWKNIWQGTKAGIKTAATIN